MRKFASFFVLFGMCAVPAFAAVELSECVGGGRELLHESGCRPDSHTRACALTCAEKWFRHRDPGKQFLKFDAAGNTKIVGALKASARRTTFGWM